MGTYHKIIKRIWHKDYKEKPNNILEIEDNDVGLVKTETPLTIQGDLGKLLNMQPVTNLHDGNFTLYGFGKSENGWTEDLHQIQVDLALDRFCGNYKQVEQGRAICFWSKDKFERSDSGDSGSPVVFQTPCCNTVVMLITGGKTTSNGNEMYGPNISYYQSWIQEQIKS